MTVGGGTGEPGASVRALPWQIHAASAIGSAHAQDGRPNQDAVAHQLLTPPGGSDLLVVTIADGHGDVRHFRSDRGAKMAVAAGIAAMRDWSAGISGSPAEIKQSARRGLVPGIVARWNAAVAADLADDQFTTAERDMLAELELPPQTAYGSTLLIGAFTDDHAVFAQIGDGNIVAVAAQCASPTGSGDDSTIALVINSAARPRRGLSGTDPHRSHTETIPAQTLELPVPPVPRAASGNQGRQGRSGDRRDRAPGERRRGWPRNRAGAWTAAAIAVVLAVLLLGFLLLGHGQR